MNGHLERPEPGASDARGASIGDAYPWLYEQIFHTASDALIVVGSDGTVRLANQQSERLFGTRALRSWAARSRT